MQVHYQITNNGDGSYGLIFFESQEALDTFMMGVDDPEYYPGESDGILDLNVESPSDVRTLEQVEEFLKLSEDDRWDYDWGY